MKLLQHIALAIAAIFHSREVITALKVENDTLRADLKTQSDALADLKLQQEQEILDDEALVKAARDAEEALLLANERATELQVTLDRAEAASAELAAAINEDPETPTVDGDFNVVSTPPVGEAGSPAPAEALPATGEVAA